MHITSRNAGATAEGTSVPAVLAAVAVHGHHADPRCDLRRGERSPRKHFGEQAEGREAANAGHALEQSELCPPRRGVLRGPEEGLRELSQAFLEENARLRSRSARTTSLVAVLRRYFSLPILVTSSLRLATSAASSFRADVPRPRSSGSTLRANCAKRIASIRSIFTRRPVARA